MQRHNTLQSPHIIPPVVTRFDRIFPEPVAHTLVQEREELNVAMGPLPKGLISQSLEMLSFTMQAVHRYQGTPKIRKSLVVSMANPFAKPARKIYVQSPFFGTPRCFDPLHSRVSAWDGFDSS